MTIFVRMADAPLSEAGSLPHLDAARLGRLLDGAPVVESLLAAYRARPATPLRQRFGQADGREMIVMPTWGDPYGGVKILTVIPANAGTALPVISGLFTLYDMESGAALATMDASELTARRTAGVAAAAADRLARPDARTLTLVGAGHIIPSLGAAHAAVRPIDRILIWARRPEAARAAADRLRARLEPDRGIMVEAHGDLEAAVRQADIVSAATRATTPLIEGAWLSPGTHVDLVGGYRPDMREIDDDGIARSTIFVDDRIGALAEAGDLIDPIANGVATPASIRGDLADLALGLTGRSGADEITLFKSVGVAASDLAVAVLAWRRHAEQRPQQG